MGSTVTCTYAVSRQPPAFVPVTVNVVVEVGDAVTELPVVPPSPVAGLQLYVEPPEAVRVVEEPLQIAILVGDTVTVGLLATLTIATDVSLQEPVVPVTVYVVVEDGVAITLAPVVALSPADGVHE
jgi:hypothetical protein